MCIQVNFSQDTIICLHIFTNMIHTNMIHTNMIQIFTYIYKYVCLHIFTEYNDNTLQYDIALLRLASPTFYTSYIQPACMPLQGVDIPVGTECVITGWGNVQEGGYGKCYREVVHNIHLKQFNIIRLAVFIYK